MFEVIKFVKEKLHPSTYLLLFTDKVDLSVPTFPAGLLTSSLVTMKPAQKPQ